MIKKLTLKYFISWIFILTICFVWGGVCSYFDGGFENKTVFDIFKFGFAFYLFFGFFGLIGSFILAIGSVGVETTANALKDIDKYNAKDRN